MDKNVDLTDFIIDMSDSPSLYSAIVLLQNHMWEYGAICWLITSVTDSEGQTVF